MHARQPIHASRSRSTMPSLRFDSALTGQIVTHGAFVQWLQRSTAKWRFTAGKRPFSWYLTQVRKLATGTSFSDLHATVQAWQPMQRRWSIRNPYCMGGAKRAHHAARASRDKSEPRETKNQAAIAARAAHESHLPRRTLHGSYARTISDAPASSATAPKA